MIVGCNKQLQVGNKDFKIRFWGGYDEYIDQPTLVLREATIDEFIAHVEERNGSISAREVTAQGITHFYEVSTD